MNCGYQLPEGSDGSGRDTDTSIRPINPHINPINQSYHSYQSYQFHITSYQSGAHTHSSQVAGSPVRSLSLPHQLILCLCVCPSVVFEAYQMVLCVYVSLWYVRPEFRVSCAPQELQWHCRPQHHSPHLTCREGQERSAHTHRVDTQRVIRYYTHKKDDYLVCFLRVFTWPSKGKTRPQLIRRLSVYLCVSMCARGSCAVPQVRVRRPTAQVPPPHHNYIICRHVWIDR